uniref:Uncharacterized protein n=1 Tax=Romanomermis culicivorax TaxID=13658 RepID=A0A915IG08_ROMCU
MVVKLGAIGEKFLKAIIVDKNMPDYVNEEEKDSPIYLYLNRKVTDDDRTRDNFYSPVYNLLPEHKDPFEPKIDPQTKKYILEKLHILPEKRSGAEHVRTEKVYHEEDEEEEIPYDKKKEIWLKYGYFD